MEVMQKKALKRINKGTLKKVLHLLLLVAIHGGPVQKVINVAQDAVAVLLQHAVPSVLVDNHPGRLRALGDELEPAHGHDQVVLRADEKDVAGDVGNGVPRLGVEKELRWVWIRDFYVGKLAQCCAM